MIDIYTEEDRINYLLHKSANFRRMLNMFELELDFTKQPPVKYKPNRGRYEGDV